MYPARPINGLPQERGMAQVPVSSCAGKSSVSSGCRQRSTLLTPVMPSAALPLLRLREGSGCGCLTCMFSMSSRSWTEMSSG
eukprot:8849091-Heterocapsa_arctica.AAC.1